MLNKILKIAAYGGLLGFGAKKAYDHFKKEEKSSSEKVTEDFQSTPSVDSQKSHLETDNNASEKAQKVEDPMMTLIKSATTKSLDQAHFYNHLKSHLPKASKNWSNEQKNEFVRAVLSTFEGAFRWDYYHAEHHANILDMCNAKGTMRDCLRFVAELFPDVEQGKRLALILKEVERIQNRLKTPIYDKNQTPSVKFKDVRFKFAIIQQLMAKEQLKPVFNYRLFVEEFSYFIDPDFPSSEAGDYMLNLDITQYQLNRISYLNLNKYSGDFQFLHLPSSVTGDISIHHFDYRYRPADIVPMTTNIIEDLALLPNLKSIYLPEDKPFDIIDIRKFGWYKLSDGTYLKSENGIEIDNLTLPRIFLEALKEKGIKVYHHSGTELDLDAILNEKSA